MLASLAAAALLSTAPATLGSPFEARFLDDGWLLHALPAFGDDASWETSAASGEDDDCRLTRGAFPGLRSEEAPFADAPIRWVGINGHRERSGEWVIYQHLLRGADRPYAYSAYDTPVAGYPVSYPYDLDQPDVAQRRDAELLATGHGGVDILAPMGTLIRMVTLDHQVGAAEVLYVGHLFGTSVVTLHRVREGRDERDYVVIFGHLDQASDRVRRGATLEAGDIVGTVGDSDSPGRVHLHFEARRVRQGVDPWSIPAPRFDEREFSVVSDPRNVLPLRETPRPSLCRANFAPARPRALQIPAELRLDDAFVDVGVAAAANIVGWERLATVLHEP